MTALENATKAKLANINNVSSKTSHKTSDENRKKAIEEINREILKTNSSYEVAKKALDEWKEKLISNLGEASQANQKYLDLIDQIYSVKLKSIYDKSLSDSQKWQDGATRALQNYVEEASNAAKNAESVFGNALHKIEDTLTDMVTSSEISFEKIGNLILSIEQDIMRSFIRQNITAPMASSLGNMINSGGFFNFFSNMSGSVFHEGGKVGETVVSQRPIPSHLFINATRLHNGLMPDEFPAILQKGETVLPKNAKAGNVNVTFNITTPNSQSFMESRGQIMAKFANEMHRFRVRNS